MSFTDGVKKLFVRAFNSQSGVLNHIFKIIIIRGLIEAKCETITFRPAPNKQDTICHIDGTDHPIQADEKESWDDYYEALTWLFDASEARPYSTISFAPSNQAFSIDLSEPDTFGELITLAEMASQTATDKLETTKNQE